MATVNQRVPDDAMPRGNVGYAYDPDGKHSYPVIGSTAGQTDAIRPIIAQREYFIFYPGAGVLASTSTVDGMVLSGVRSGAGTVTTAGSVTTAWTPAATYSPLRAGKIDGVSTGGIVSGQITVGLKTPSGTQAANAGVTARIYNVGAAAGSVTCLFLSATVLACTSAEIYSTYDIPKLQTTAAFNAIPFTFQVGVQSSKAAASAAIVARIMESSYIDGYFEPGT